MSGESPKIVFDLQNTTKGERRVAMVALRTCHDALRKSRCHQRKLTCCLKPCTNKRLLNEESAMIETINQAITVFRERQAKRQHQQLVQNQTKEPFVNRPLPASVPAR